MRASADAVAELTRDPHGRGGGGLPPRLVGAGQRRGRHQGGTDVTALVANRSGDGGDVVFALPVIDRVAQAADLGDLLEQLTEAGQGAGRGRLQSTGRVQGGDLLVGAL